MGTILKSIAGFCILTMVALAASCTQPNASPATNNVSVETPLGFDWKAASLLSYDKITAIERDCKIQLAQLPVQLTTAQNDRLIDDCVAPKISEVFIPIEQVPAFFRDGEVGITVKGRDKVLAYNYSYLHRLVTDQEYATNRRKRQLHASAIREQIEGLYGAAEARGYFNEFSRGGFIFAADKTKQPCELWIVSNTGILLCEERSILIDGMEMSLSYLKLDLVPFGETFRCIANTKTNSECMVEEVLYDHPNENTPTLAILSEWLKPSRFKDCESPELRSLNEVLNLPPSLLGEAKQVTDTYQGEDLAQYVYENSGELTKDAEQEAEDRMMMYLLMKASEQGSASATNEIGASSLYCYQGVRQNLTQARDWLEKASSMGDAYAYKSLAYMHLNEMTEAEDSIEEAFRLLTDCHQIDPDYCQHQLRAVSDLRTPDEN